jgi:hypothetical protein
MVAIQHIIIQWTKASRGGRLAECRSQIPHEFLLPSPPPIYDRLEHYILHRIDFAEQNQFKEPIRQKVIAPTIDVQFQSANCSLDINVEIPTLKFQWRDGAPMRTTVKSFVIPENRWVRVEYNCRFTDRYSGEWYYEHEIINVAQVTAETLDIFVATEPTILYQDLAHLW